MNILITGGNGFIGSHLAEDLIKKGNTVSLIDLKFTKNTEHLTCKKIVGDITDKKIVEKSFKGKDIVVHLAALSRVELSQKDPHKCFSINVLGTLNAILACLQNNSVFIYASSREVYGEPVSLPIKESDFKNPISVYGVSKLAAELLCKTYASASCLKYVIMRFSNVYGSQRDLPERVIPKFMKAVLTGSPLTIYGGDQTLDFIFIDDAIKGISKIIENISDNNTAIINNDFNLMRGTSTKIYDLARTIVQITQSDSEIIVLKRRTFDVTNFVGDNSKASYLLGYDPKYSLHNGLKEYHRRIKSAHNRNNSGN
ncbi:nucleoside-diphosphate-sugar epimerase [Thaumarchaeota archaeon SCGC AB-539-E09]|nr:nucleoside-diphosphate-sugar epimerase [Thaumarchaeota archaeon SCGC AB-539-E09]